MPTRVFRNVVKDLSTEEPAPAPLSGFGFAGMAGLLLGHRESHGLLKSTLWTPAAEPMNCLSTLYYLNKMLK